MRPSPLTLTLTLLVAGCVPALDGADRVLIYDYVDGAVVPVERPLSVPVEDLLAGRSSRTQILIGGEIVLRSAADSPGYFAPTHDFLLGPTERAAGASVMASPGVVGTLGLGLEL